MVGQILKGLLDGQCRCRGNLWLFDCGICANPTEVPTYHIQTIRLGVKGLDLTGGRDPSGIELHAHLRGGDHALNLDRARAVLATEVVDERQGEMRGEHGRRMAVSNVRVVFHGQLKRGGKVVGSKSLVTCKTISGNGHSSVISTESATVFVNFATLEKGAEVALSRHNVRKLDRLHVHGVAVAAAGQHVVAMGADTLGAVVPSKAAITAALHRLVKVPKLGGKRRGDLVARAMPNILGINLLVA